MKPYEEFKEQLKSISKLDARPKLLLHSCCGPCSCHVLNLLAPYFDITILYYNPNIYPLEEFYKRLENQKNLLKQLPYKVDLLVIEEDYQVFLEATKAYHHLKEKSLRCYECYKFRMIKLSKVAMENNFDFFTTTLSVSPHKNSQWINEIGFSLDLPSCHYLYSDFKKENGYLESNTMAKKYNLYRQNYCGCGFSLQESQEKKI